jgi:hypothetical protein
MWGPGCNSHIDIVSSRSIIGREFTCGTLQKLRLRWECFTENVTAYSSTLD